MMKYLRDGHTWASDKPTPHPGLEHLSCTENPGGHRIEDPRLSLVSHIIISYAFSLGSSMVFYMPSLRNVLST